ncbi:MAG: DUF1232 domain-containing protein, partial [Bacteroidia bacterium]|nr:DUF1232 domain-containing protein [Bacteroidia bacterium]
LKVRLAALSRLLSAYALGRYRIIPFKTVLTVTAGILYFLNPFDLIPDAIFGLGLTDDIAVLAWVYRASQLEMNKFIQWEKTQPSTAGLNFN